MLSKASIHCLPDWKQYACSAMFSTNAHADSVICTQFFAGKLWIKYWINLQSGVTVPNNIVDNLEQHCCILFSTGSDFLPWWPEHTDRELYSNKFTCCFHTKFITSFTSCSCVVRCNCVVFCGSHGTAYVDFNTCGMCFGVHCFLRDPG